MYEGIEVEETDGFKATIFAKHIVAVCEMYNYNRGGRFTRIFLSAGEHTYIDTHEAYEVFMARLEQL